MPSASSADPKRSPVFLDFPLNDLVKADPRYEFRSAKWSTFDNAVNSTMARDRWSSGVDYDAILSVLQIAAKLIDSPRSRHYFSASILSVPREVNYTDQAGSYQSIFRKSMPLSFVDVVKLNKFWTDFAPFVKFEVGAFKDPNINAGTRREKNRPLPTEVFPVPNIGHASTIRVSQRMYDGVIKAVRDHRKDPDCSFNQDRLFAGFFGLATTLVHELAHAVSMARWPDERVFNMPFENRLFSEAGYDWESCVFDGIVQSLGAYAWLTEWPAGEKVEPYLRRRGTDIGVTGSFEALTSADHSNAWMIPPCFIRVLFQKKFWQTTYPSLGDAAFDFPRLLGFRTATQGLGTYSQCYCESCFRMKEFAMRARRRENQAIKAQGSYDVELTNSENVRIAAEKKREQDEDR